MNDLKEKNIDNIKQRFFNVCQNGDTNTIIDCITELKESHISINIRNDKKKTGLILASQENNLSAVKILTKQ